MSRVSLGDGLRRHVPAAGASIADGRPSPSELTAALQTRAQQLGFSRCGVALPTPMKHEAEDLERFLAAGRHGQMAYLGKRDEQGRLLRQGLESVFPGAQSVVVTALPYGRPVPFRRPAQAEKLTGQVAGYAGGDDYHHVLKERLLILADFLARTVGEAIEARPLVDTAPVFERQWSRQAGLSFLGKNTLAIAPGAGSYFVLGELVTSIELAASAPLSTEGCGRCRACLEACPTNALDDEWRIDARRCISYLTIEHRGDIPEEFRRAMGLRVFGCDECQVVCPYNSSKNVPAGDPSLRQRTEWQEPDLIELLRRNASQHRRAVKNTALRRVNREQLARNAAVALGNTGSARAIAPLAECLATHDSPQVQRHAAWALGELADRGHAPAVAALERHSKHPDLSVRWAVEHARGH